MSGGAAGALGKADLALLALFVLGIYTGIDLHVSAAIPIPSALAGASGLVLLWRRRNDVVPRHLMAFLLVIIVYLCSVLFATNLAFLPKRFTGFVQLVYSLTIGYAVFLTLLRADRRQVAGLFLVIGLFILVGALLEDDGPLRPISDAVRAKLYDQGQIYDADLRDQLLYGRIRPKVFASEPSAVTFAYTLVVFAWLLFSTWRWKFAGYLALMGAGLFAMPGPTLLLMVLLVIPYVLLATRDWGSGMIRAIVGLCLCAALLGVFVVLGQTIYAARLHQILLGQDASFYYREIGPALTARNVDALYPIAGAGLTGEIFIADLVTNVYMRSGSFSPSWVIGTPLTSAFITNYVWLHWIYLGLGWGALALAALTFWLKVLGVPSAPFCWIVWTIMGQASGAYVGPKTWAVLMLAAAGAVVVERDRRAMATRETILFDDVGRLMRPVLAQTDLEWS